MQVPAHEEFTTIYEAQADGVYTFATTGNGEAPGAASFNINGGLTFSSPNYDGGNFSVFMSVGDLLKHKGVSVQLTGYRIGSEF